MTNSDRIEDASAARPGGVARRPHPFTPPAGRAVFSCACPPPACFVGERVGRLEGRVTYQGASTLDRIYRTYSNSTSDTPEGVSASLHRCAQASGPPARQTRVPRARDVSKDSEPRRESEAEYEVG